MNFDLNIDNYTKCELVEMFELPSNYNENLIQIKGDKLKSSIFQNKEITTETKNQVTNFIVKAKNLLMGDINHQEIARPNPIQKKLLDLYNTSYELKPVQLDDPSEHMLQVRPDKPYLSSYPSEYFPGIINPLKKKTIKQNLNIDTRFRDNYYSTSSTNFNLQLPTQFNNVLQMTLASIELPTTYYTISKQLGTNYFTVTVDGVSNIVEIPNGNYNPDGMINAINFALSRFGGQFNYVTFSININGNNGSGQTIVGISPSYTGSAFSIELNFQLDRFGNEDRNTPLPLKLGWMLGFRNGVYINNENYVSEGIVDLTGPKYLYLVIDDFLSNVNNSFYSAFNSSILNRNIIARITTQAPNFSIFSENNLNLITLPREYFGPTNLNNFQIQLLDEYGRIVDLNNMDFSFCLNLTLQYDI